MSVADDLCTGSPSSAGNRSELRWLGPDCVRQAIVIWQERGWYQSMRLAYGVPFVLALLSTIGFTTVTAQSETETENLEITYRFNGDGTGRKIVHARYRCDTPRACAGASRFPVTYSSEYESVAIEWFRTVKKDGSIVTADPAEVLDSTPEVGAAGSYLPDTKQKTMLFPRVEPGDSMEYRVVVETRKARKPGDFWASYARPRDFVVKSETVVLDLPATRQVVLYENPAVANEKTDTADGRRIVRWALGNPFRSGVGDEVVFAVSTIPSWNAFGDWIRGVNEAPMKVTPEIQALAVRLTAGKTNESDRIEALYTYVSQKVRNISTSFGDTAFQPHESSEVLQNGYGDCKDKHGLLVALLRAAGFKTGSVFVSLTHGVQFPGVPMPQFDHEFTAVETGGGQIFLDSTIELAPPQLLRVGVRWRKALLVGATASKIIDVPQDSPVVDGHVQKWTGRIDSSGGLEATVRVEFRGSEEVLYRRVFRDASAAQQENVIRALSGKELQRAAVSNVKHSSPEDLHGSFWLEWTLKDPAFISPVTRSKRITFRPVHMDFRPLQDMSKEARPSRVMKREDISSVDLEVSSDFIATSHQPIDESTPWIKYRSESNNVSGHLHRSYVFEATGAAMAGSDWPQFIRVIRLVQEDGDFGVLLERRAMNAPARTTELLRTGLEALGRGNYEAARASFQEATQLDARHRSAWNNLGRAYAGLRQYEKAEEAFRRQIEINPKDAYAYNNLGLAYRAQGRLDEAVAEFRKQIEIGPRDRFAHLNLAMTLAAQRKWEESRQEAEIATEIDPSSTAPWICLGTAQARTGKLDAARHSFDRALQLNYDPPTLNNVAYQLTEAGMDLEKAWLLASSALNAQSAAICNPEKLGDPSCGAQLRRMSASLDTAGWVLLKQNKKRDAEPYLVSAYAISPGPEIAQHLAWFHLRSERLEKALEFFALLPQPERLHADELRRELEKSQGGPQQLESRLRGLARRPLGSVAFTETAGEFEGVTVPLTVTIQALVDETGKVADARADTKDSRADAALRGAKHLTLLPLCWPGYALRSVRTIEFRFAPGKPVEVVSFVQAGSASTGPPGNSAATQ